MRSSKVVEALLLSSTTGMGCTFPPVRVSPQVEKAMRVARERPGLRRWRLRRAREGPGVPPRMVGHPAEAAAGTLVGAGQAHNAKAGALPVVMVVVHRGSLSPRRLRVAAVAPGFGAVAGGVGGALSDSSSR